MELSSALNAGEINASYLLEQELADIERRQVMLNCYVELDEVARGVQQSIAIADGEGQGAISIGRCSDCTERQY